MWGMQPKLCSEDECILAGCVSEKKDLKPAISLSTFGSQKKRKLIPKERQEEQNKK